MGNFDESSSDGGYTVCWWLYGLLVVIHCMVVVMHCMKHIGDGGAKSTLSWTVLASLSWTVLAKDFDQLILNEGKLGCYQSINTNYELSCLKSVWVSLPESLLNDSLSWVPGIWSE